MNRHVRILFTVSTLILVLLLSAVHPQGVLADGGTPVATDPPAANPGSNSSTSSTDRRSGELCLGNCSSGPDWFYKRRAHRHGYLRRFESDPGRYERGCLE